MSKDIDEEIYRFTHAEIVKEFLLTMIDLLNKYETLSKSQNVTSEDVLKWMLEITLRETEIAQRVAKHEYFEEIINKIKQSLNIFDKPNFIHVLNLVRESLTKATSIGAFSHSNLLKK